MEKTNDKAKIEYGKWLNTLDESELTQDEITVINMITEHFDELNSKDVVTRNELERRTYDNSEKFTKLLVAYADQANGSTLNKVNFENPMDEKDEVQRLSSIEIESFRGFMKKTLPISLEKEFTLVWGANGAGKTSFCEALEYALTKNVTEAGEKKIKLLDYIKNRYTDMGKAPRIIAKYKGNEKKVFSHPHYKYEFAFIERNHIDAFSRFSSFENRGTYEQLADLFGMTDFYVFVNTISFSYVDGKEYSTRIDRELEDKYNNITNICKVLESNISKLTENEMELEKELSSIAQEKDEKDHQESLIKKHSITKIKEECVEELSEYKKENERFVVEYKRQEELVERNIKLREATREVSRKLTEYRKKLMKNLADRISGMVKDFYNAINEGDAEYELIEDIKMLDRDIQVNVTRRISDRILVHFKGSPEDEYVDAMHVLSEGHVKILGLSMLLAKACNDNMPFLVFDDIVNAMDDDHRVGVAKLLAGTSIDSPLKKMQKIVTCHGRHFISLLADEIHSSARYNEYVLLPADVRGTRDIEIKLKENDSAKVIKRAIEAYKEDERKIALLYCRQAAESITEKLWKTLEIMGIEVIVEKKSFNRDPDLYTRVKGLINSLEKEIVKNKTEGLQEIVDMLSELVVKQRLWRLMNEGAHYNNDQSEFNRDEISIVIGLLEQLDTIVNSMSIEKRVSCNIIEPTKLD